MDGHERKDTPKHHTLVVNCLLFLLASAFNLVIVGGVFISSLLVDSVGDVVQLLAWRLDGLTKKDWSGYPPTVSRQLCICRLTAEEEKELDKEKEKHRKDAQQSCYLPWRILVDNVCGCCDDRDDSRSLSGLTSNLFLFAGLFVQSGEPGARNDRFNIGNPSPDLQMETSLLVMTTFSPITVPRYLSYPV